MRNADTKIFLESLTYNQTQSEAPSCNESLRLEVDPGLGSQADPSRFGGFGAGPSGFS